MINLGDGRERWDARLKTNLKLRMSLHRKTTLLGSLPTSLSRSFEPI